MLQKPINQSSQQPNIIEDQAKKRQRGTGFTNISKVLGANVGSGQKMGQAIGGQLGQQAEQVRKGIEQGQSKFQSGLQKEQQKRQETVGAATGAIGSILTGQQQPDTNYEQIGQNLRDLQYAGPKSIENIEEQQQRATNLAALGRLSGMAGGQQQLLRSQVAGRGRYGLGQSSLDALLLGKEGQRELQAARSQTGQLETQAQQVEKMAQAQAQAESAQTEAAKLSALQKGQSEFQNIEDTAAQQGEKFVSDVNKYQKLLSGGLNVGNGPNQIDEQEALSLIKRAEAGEFGAISGTLFTGEEGAEKASLSALGNYLTSKLQHGGKRYLKEEKKQAADLATLLSGSKAGQDILSRTYNENLYTPTEDEKKGIFGAQQEAKERAMSSAKSEDMWAVNKLINKPTDQNDKHYADWQALERLSKEMGFININKNIDDRYDKAVGRGKNWSDAAVGPNDAFFRKYAALAGYEHPAWKHGGSAPINRQQYKNIVGKGMAVERQQQIQNTDYAKDKRIESKEKNVFKRIREKLGLEPNVIRDPGNLGRPRQLTQK